ncbi:hypothetical protein [Nocardia sp. NPDC057353]|uniref:hypothetical protein n=1 Tax=Nocardia sp. NPDC057353 TaxID=3346104 RepID=UPI003633B2B4
MPAAYVTVTRRLADRFGVPLVARTRVAFRTGSGTVVKVPHTWDGIAANEAEIAASRDQRIRCR